MASRARNRNRRGYEPPPDECPLTAAELAVIKLLARGRTQKQAAAQLGLAHSTIRTHLHNAYVRIDAHNTTQAVLICIRRGWLRPRDPQRPRLPRPQRDLHPVERSYVETWERFIREAPADDVLPMLLRLVRGEGPDKGS